MKKILLILCLTLAFQPLFVSCDSVADPASLTDGTTPVSDTESEMTAAAENKLPQKDFKGADFGILARVDQKYEMFADSINGQTLNDAVYQRNMLLESACNIKIVPYTQKGGWADRQLFFDTFQSSVLAGEDIYDLVAYYAATAMPAVVEGSMQDLKKVDYLDFTGEWWYPGYNDIATVNGRLYAALGDGAVTAWENMTVVLFNKDLAADYGFDSLYKKAFDGSWTFDTLLKMAEQVSKDLDGNGSFDDADLYGWLIINEPLRAMPVGFDFPLTKIGADGKPILTIGSEKYIEVFGRVYDIIWNNNFASCSLKSATNTFTSGNALFYSYSLQSIEKLRTMDADFGILPYPKYTEAQENYRTLCFDTHSVFCIPVTATDTSMSGYLLEALCRESHTSVTPAYYDVMLKGKTSRDNESEAMLDIIHDSVMFDFAIINSVTISGPYALFGNNIINKKQDVTSEIESNRGKWQKSLEDLLTFYGY